MEQHRGIGHTELMITNLPDAHCAIIVPSRNIGNAIDLRIAANGLPPLKNAA